MLRTALRVSLCLLPVLTAAGLKAAVVDSRLSAAAIQWARENIAEYRVAHADAQRPSKDEDPIPVPPEVNPPCHVCGETGMTENEVVVANWVKQNSEPESTYITELLKMARGIAPFKGDNNDNLSTDAQRAIKQFCDPECMQNDVTLLASRLYDRAFNMAHRYKNEPNRFYAGMMFVMYTAKQAELAGVEVSDAGLSQELSDWAQKVLDYIDLDVFGGHSYNLCPVFGFIVHSITLYGGQDVDTDWYLEMTQAMTKFMEFDVELTLVVKDDSPSGYVHASWTGKAKLTLTPKFTESCFTPSFENQSMAVNVTSFDSAGVIEKSNGSHERIPVQLVSPRSYTAKLGVPQLDLCADHPTFQFPAINIQIPREEVLTNGEKNPASFFPMFLAAVAVTNEIDSSKTDAVTGQRPTLAAGATDSDQGSTPAAEPNAPSQGDDEGPARTNHSIDQLKQVIDSHKGDLNWLMSPEGQAAFNELMQKTTTVVQTKLASKGFVLPKGNNIDALMQSASSVHLPWTNGLPQPVNKTLHVKKNTLDATLTLTVTQVPQPPHHIRMPKIHHPQPAPN